MPPLVKIMLACFAIGVLFSISLDIRRIADDIHTIASPPIAVDTN